MNRPPSTRRKARGAALLIAMLTVTLVATLAAASLWQQWRSVEVEAADRQRVQSSWILTGALDWARLILREDAMAGNTDNLAEPWAVPLQEARLSTFLAADPTSGVAEAGSDADNVFLSGDITDLQSRLNITSLLQAGKINQLSLDVFRRLFDLLGLPQAELATMTENLRFASDISIDNLNASRASLMPHRVEQLVWLGLSPETVAALQPYVTVLPAVTPVDLNTAPAEVIYAEGANIGLADAQRLVAERSRQAFRSMSDVIALLPSGAKFIDNNQLALGSRFFEVRGRLRIDDVVIEERSIVQRNGQNVQTIQRERGASETTAPRLTQR
jgi:general secretion pathway protein K